MAGNCPHCGISLPPIGDSFCPECRGALEEVEPANVSLQAEQYEGLEYELGSWLPRLTFIGRLVVLIYALAAFGGTVSSIFFLYESLPPGGYSLMYFWLPFAVLAIVLCAMTLRVLDRFGVKIYHDPPNSK